MSHKKRKKKEKEGKEELASLATNFFCDFYRNGIKLIDKFEVN
jgi:hypothetical protein